MATGRETREVSPIDPRAEDLRQTVRQITVLTAHKYELMADLPLGAMDAALREEYEEICTPVQIRDIREVYGVLAELEANIPPSQHTDSINGSYADGIRDALMTSLNDPYDRTDQNRIVHLDNLKRSLVWNMGREILASAGILDEVHPPSKTSSKNILSSNTHAADFLAGRIDALDWILGRSPELHLPYPTNEPQAQVH